ncbi:toxin co-regulated pilus biosynthesis Q family protein [Vibrio antiquarius]|uniref:Toxin co-regulated pilus biosynthesis Q family protein n=2 Tax=Vibrio TaxID=662 RepID=A0AA46Z4E3_VIBPH|nr:toxin co-regulated pilus biosynthesis Q family protein [Vibrio parahaemolyticus]MCS0312262.1 toxin co-regulated pilus biosynthesis Q family protein [Vibrio diabolicus]EGR3229762.1 hypothetical protein [Vibrio parahaemolyticus]EGR5929824.1 hypothetical protein [Vibrio parahaemolyticus]MCS0116615.1 toxin co-regulated pilus biosynthesis Q family protein [Vibrio parahaemolyticus]UYV29546.1 toxin co-regulated pilus biosynthesis Q family protein [Vibrio parahaemolyticus]
MINNNKTNKKSKIMLSVASIATLSGAFAPFAQAELYISPLVRESVVIDNELNQKLSNKDEGAVVVGESKDYGKFVMQEKAKVEKKAFGYGKNVPLFVAAEANIPVDDGWLVHIDESIQKKPVSWESNSDSWEDTIKIIGEQNNLNVVINPVEKSIGISGKEKPSLAKHLANRVPEVWVLTPGKTLKKNLEDWSKKAGWQLHWDDALKVDYMIEHKATMTGKFLDSGDEDGVITQVLDSLADAHVPLRAEFYKKNKVLLITEAGFKQEVKY